MRLLAGCALLGSALMVQAQTSVISAKAGLIHYTEGSVFLDGKEVANQNAKFNEMKKASVLRTGEGRAEVLLAPGSFVRLTEQSGLEMLDNDLMAPKLRLTDGSAMIEASELTKEMAITLSVGETTLTVRKAGIYRVETKPTPALKVYDGEVTVENSGKSIVAKEGKMLALNTGGEFVLAKFDNNVGDELYRWSKRRSGYVSMANVAAANRIYTRGDSLLANGWVFNPYFGMFTFVPMRGMFRSPFGYRYFSPQAAYNMVVAPTYASSFGGGSTGYTGGFSDSGFGAGSYNTGMRSSGGYNGGYAPSAGGYNGGYQGGSSGGYTGGMSAPAGGGAAAASSAASGGVRGGGSAAAGGGQSAGGGSRGN